MRWFAADLHVHSALSPCGDLAMSPSRILARAREVGLDLLAVTDHNMAENGAALGALAQGSGVSVLFGMELETAEEVHVLCLFDSLGDALEWQRVVYDHLPPTPNDPDRFGDQVVVDEQDNVVRFEERRLTSASDIPLVEACALVEARGGLAIPAHVDRPVQSLLSELEGPPVGLFLRAVELSPFAPPGFAVPCDWLREVPCVRFSDAHFVHEIGVQRTFFRLAQGRVPELRMALSGESGRCVRDSAP